MTATREKFTAADYRMLPEGFPAELVDGMLVKEPSPSRWHQSLAAEVHYRLRALLGPGRVLASPVDVFVDHHNVLLPDVLVLASEDRVEPASDPSAIPILVVEVLSPATAVRDRDVKAAVYLRAGVREVWLVDPEAETIEVRTPDGSTRYDATRAAESCVVDGFRLSFGELASPGAGCG